MVLAPWSYAAFDQLVPDPVPEQVRVAAPGKGQLGIQRADSRLTRPEEPVTLEPDLPEHREVGGVAKVALSKRLTVSPCRHLRLVGSPNAEEQRQEPPAHGQHLSEEP